MEDQEKEEPGCAYTNPPKLDIERLRKAVASPSIQIPRGLSREEMRQFILDSAEQVKEQK